MAISNSVQLQADINAKVAIAINNVAEKLTLELKRIIEAEVYNYGETWGGRTYQFGESWNNTVPIIMGNMVQSTIEQYDGSLYWDSDEWQHGNKWEALDINSLNDIINDGLGSSNFGFPAIKARPFWTEFTTYLNTNFPSLFETEMMKVGLYGSSTSTNIMY